MNRRLEKPAPSLLQVNLSPNLTVYSCITPENQLTVTFIKEEKIDTTGQTVLRKQQIVCAGAEIEAFKKYLSLLEYFQLYHVFTRENEKVETNHFKRAVPVLMSLDDETLPDDIKQLIKENNVESIVFRDKQDSMNANYTITYKQGDEDSGYVSYEFFIAK